jgi:hypothetical protein
VFECIANHLDHISRTFEDIDIPKANDAAAMRFQPPCASEIAVHAFFVRVRRSVQFDNEPRFRTEEIGDIGTYRCLPAKTKPRKPLSAEQKP